MKEAPSSVAPPKRRSYQPPVLKKHLVAKDTKSA